MKQLLVATIAALVLGVGLGHMIGGSREPAPVVVAPKDDGSARTIEELRQQVAKLQTQLKEARSRRINGEVSEKNAAASEDSREEQQESNEGSSAVQESIVHERVPVDEAKLRAAELLKSRDPEGLLLLAADLLQQGEDGFAKLIELLQWLEAADEETEGILNEMFGRNEELYVGRFLKLLADNDEEFLRFGLYLKERTEEDGSTGSSMMDDLTRELTNDFGPVLLGFYDGEDEELLAGYFDWYRETLDTQFDKDRVFGIAQIPTDEATDLLLDLSEEKGGHELGWIIQALAWKNDPRALETLRRLEADVSDPTLQDQIRSAITKLESL